MPPTSSSSEMAQLDTSCLPAYRASHQNRYHPYPRTRAYRYLPFDDPLQPMSFPATLYTGPRLDCILQPTIVEEDENGLPNLAKAISYKALEGRIGCLSLHTLVIDLALTVRRSLQLLRGSQIEGKIEFEMLT